jgi:hypothetical protein
MKRDIFFPTPFTGELPNSQKLGAIMQGIFSRALFFQFVHVALGLFPPRNRKSMAVHHISE